MADVTNTAYIGGAGTLTINGDTHFGVTSFILTPTTPEEQIQDVAGGVQVLTGIPSWRAGIEFHQDHVTSGSLSKISGELAGQSVPFEYTPKTGGEGRSGNVRMKHAPFGGNANSRHAGSLDLGVIGQPAVIEPA